MKQTLLIISLIIYSITSLFGQVKSEDITINNMAIQLPGTLSYSSVNEPLIIWVHGSGGVNRNGNTPNYIQQFREEIKQKGIAFFSYDKRTSNPQNAKFIQEDGIYFSDFVSDLKEVINHFKEDNRFSEIILAGHSQGSLIAMLSLDNVAKYISIAGAGETIDKTLVRQISAQSAEFGKLTAEYVKELKETGSIKEVDPNLMPLFAKQNQPFLASWIALNPIEEITKVKIPTLIINGDKDIQVPIVDAKALKEAKPEAGLVIIKNMNHVLKNIEKDEDNLKSYMSADYPISEDLINTIVAFIKK
ncbi:alpha/beta hydrolase family protein [Polaribacter sp. P097]|uniref:alpha/beta hydrolase family protein n=1 Tax=Polaribacter sp. P097 TaxID=3117398 RepID=UPI002FE383C8